MMPLSEVCDLFESLGSVQKYLALPATLAARDMENIVTRFQGILSPDALVLTKLDEATDNACFGKLLTVQAKSGLPLAYVTTGQKVPDDITFPDAHAIAARILTTALL
jgi:flagellar biosynthesis protein FlhF